MTTDGVEQLRYAQDQRLTKIETAQHEGDARLGKESVGSSPRGLCKRLERIDERLRAIFPAKPQVPRRRSWIAALAVWLWHVLLVRVLRRPAPEPEPEGWPPSRPILMPLDPDLRRAWKQRFGEVTHEAATLDAEAARRREDADRYESEWGRLPQRLQEARCIEVATRPPMDPAPTPSRQPEGGRIAGSLPTRPRQAATEPRQKAPASRSPLEPKTSVLTVEDLLHATIPQPFSAVAIQDKFSDPMNQYQVMLGHIEQVEKEVLLGTN